MSDLTITIPGEPPLVFSSVGVQGPRGADGTNGVDGTNGTDGVDGVDGNDGAEGPPGPGTLLKDDKTALRAETGTTTAQLPDGSLWEVSSTTGHVSADDDDATALLRPDGRLWERVISDGVVLLDWWPLDFATDATGNSDLLRAAFAVCEAGNATFGAFSLQWPAKTIHFDTRLPSFPNKVNQKWVSGETILHMKQDLPARKFTGVTGDGSSTLILPFGSDDGVVLGSLRVVRWDVTGVFNEPISHEPGVDFTAVIGASSTTITLAVSLGTTHEFLVYDAANVGAINIAGQLIQFEGYPLIKRDGTQTSGAMINITAQDSPDHDYGDDSFLGIHGTFQSGSSWMFGIHVDGQFKETGAVGVREVVFDRGMLFGCTEAFVWLAGSASFRGQFNASEAGVTSREGIVVMGQGSVSSTNIDITIANATSVLIAKANIADIKCGSLNRLHTTSASDNVTISCSNTGPGDANISIDSKTVLTTRTGRYSGAGWHNIMSDTGVLNALDFITGGTSRGYVGWSSGGSGLMQIVSSAGDVRLSSDSLIQFDANGTFSYMSSTSYFPNDVGGLDIGQNAIPFGDGYFQNAITVTSDELTKTDMQVLKPGNEFFDKFQKVVPKINWLRFKIRDGGKRWHYGLGARELWELLKAHDIDPLETGFMIRSPWVEMVDGPDETISIPNLDDDGAVILDDDGQPTRKDELRPTKIERRKVDLESGEPMWKYAIRYQELHNALRAVLAVETQLTADRLDALEAAQVGAG